MCEESYKDIKEYFDLQPIVIEVENKEELNRVFDKIRTVDGAFQLGFTQFALFKPFTVRIK